MTANPRQPETTGDAIESAEDALIVPEFIADAQNIAPVNNACANEPAVTSRR